MSCARRAPYLALALTVTVGVAVVPGCSLLGLSHIPLGVCEDSAACEPLNERDGLLASSCERWNCGLAGHCVLGPRDLDADGDPDPDCAAAATDCDDSDPHRAGTLLESCDGVDNDCDSIVDETALSAPAVTELAALRAGDRIGASSSAGPGLAVLATGPAGLADVAFVHDGTSAGARDVGHASQGADCTASPCTSGSLADTSLEPGDHCPVFLGTSLGDGSCNEADVAIDAIGGTWITATVSTTGCAEGRLEVGPFIDEVDTRILLRGPIARSNTFVGIDVGTGNESACTGQSRSGADAGVLGAARPAISAMDGTPGFPQALVGWLGDDVARAACGPLASRPVELLVVALESGPPTGTTWVTGAGDGVPLTVGHSTGAAAPALVSLSPSVGWLVAYPGATGIELAIATPMTGTFPPVPLTRAEADTPRVMPSFSVGPPFTAPFAGDDVVVALGSTAGGTFELGIVYSEPTCGGGLQFRRGHLAGATVTGLAFDAPVALGAGRNATVAYAPVGLVTAEYARDGVTAADRTGGWIVAWETDTGLRELRVLELDGRPLEPEPIVLTSDGTDAHPALYDAGGQLAFVRGTSLMGAPACPAVAP